MTTRPLFDTPPVARPKPKRIQTPVLPINPKESWRVTLTPMGAGPPGIVRVRRLLKSAYRGHKLRCIRIECVGDAGTPGIPTHNTSSEGLQGPQTAFNEGDNY